MKSETWSLQTMARKPAPTIFEGVSHRRRPGCLPQTGLMALETVLP